jgi:hypothetical protein
VDFFTSLFNLLYSFRLRQGGEDKLCWVPSKRGLFDIKSYYNVLVPYDYNHLPWRSIWWNKVPLRAVSFACSLALEKILTMDNLRKQHAIVVDWSCMCKKSRESMGHLLLRYETASALQNTIFSLEGWLAWVMAWIMPSRVMGLFACCHVEDVPS